MLSPTTKTPRFVLFQSTLQGRRHNVKIDLFEQGHRAFRREKSPASRTVAGCVGSLTFSPL